MTSFNIKPSDAGTRRIIEENRHPETAKPISTLSPTRGIHKASGPPKNLPSLSLRQHSDKQTPQHRRQSPERRKQDRRRTTTKVMLDTRIHRERRKTLQRERDRIRRSGIQQQGIDVEA